ncbi:hypothetical protein KFE96_07890 [Kordiimonas sp. SCSIO 12603]|uniref:hypothetical protein n=1 Tax=Kordiimonas sp. SCSIO 12603 TaxID=2829596 RepID=UPI0021049F4F|nr:hypothetical protein [Kordiimonas sp. SCSIO 12603]UTW60222.1 hypothetical protein KFE96_07890 [Kordiimonas sp. SCSIO 12603]
MSFDPIQQGLLSHYPPDVQQRLRRLILEDWNASGVKLPTYMKLLARHIAATGVSEDWLAKLSHQTMNKMLKSISTPRHEFWACLHLYIIKKYGPQDIAPELSDIDILGQSLVRFGDIKEVPSSLERSINGKELIINAQGGKPYALASMTETYKSNEAFAVEVTYKAEGAAVIQNNQIKAILRDEMTRQISMLEVDV